MIRILLTKIKTRQTGGNAGYILVQLEKTERMHDHKDHSVFNQSDLLKFRSIKRKN